MPAVFLKNRLLLRITGADAESFLQNLITTDLSSLGAAEARPGALLTPQGKILFDFMIWRDGAGFILETDAEQREGLLKRLTMYRLRAAVELAPEDTEGVTVAWASEATEGYEDSRFAKAGVRLLRLAGRHGDGEESLYDALRIASGIAVSGQDFALSDAFPHDVLMRHGLRRRSRRWAQHPPNRRRPQRKDRLPMTTSCCGSQKSWAPSTIFAIFAITARKTAGGRTCSESLIRRRRTNPSARNA